ncbi:hypothetical protein GCM10023238_01690 [Streptomyces heliomycini]
MLRTEPRTDPDRNRRRRLRNRGRRRAGTRASRRHLRAIGTVNATTTGRPGEAARIRCPVWAGVGSEDPSCRPRNGDAFAAEMRGAGVDWRLTVYAEPCTPSTTRRSTPRGPASSATTDSTRGEPGATSSTCSPSAARDGGPGA